MHRQYRAMQGELVHRIDILQAQIDQYQQELEESRQQLDKTKEEKDTARNLWK